MAKEEGKKKNKGRRELVVMIVVAVVFQD